MNENDICSKHIDTLCILEIVRTWFKSFKIKIKDILL